MSMTSEQRQIAIAEFEGWKQVGKNKKWLNPSGEWDFAQNIPPYLTSRDAICEVVEKLDDLRLREYAKHLQEVCHLHCVGIVPDYRRDLRNLAKITLATASQMADALLLTLRYQI
jgi:hypothetical protein